MKHLKTFLIYAIIICQTLLIASCKSPSESNNKPILEDKVIEQMDIKNESHINYFGRNYFDENYNAYMFNYTASGFEVRFEGTMLQAELVTGLNDSHTTYLAVFLDGEVNDKKATSISLDNKTPQTFTLASNLEYGVHTVKVLKRTELAMTSAGLVSLKTDGVFRTPPPKKSRKIEFYGDSITCGYGSTSPKKNSAGFLSKEENGLQTYAYFTASMLGAQSQVISYSGWAMNRSWVDPNSDTSCSIPSIADKYSKDNSADWDFSKFEADVVVINLGANDNVYIDNDARRLLEFKLRYKSFISFLRSKYTDAHIVCSFGMLGESGIYNTIISLVNEINAEGDNKVYYIKLHTRTVPDQAGADGHPLNTAHKIAGEELAVFISEKTGWDFV